MDDSGNSALHRCAVVTRFQTEAARFDPDEAGVGVEESGERADRVGATGFSRRRPSLTR